jgi:hypothetical protein
MKTEPAPIPLSPARLLAERLRELSITPTGLPSHVQEGLRALVEEECLRTQRHLDTQIAELRRQAVLTLRKQLVRQISFRSIGKVFGQAATKTTSGGAAQ